MPEHLKRVDLSNVLICVIAKVFQRESILTLSECFTPQIDLISRSFLSNRILSSFLDAKHSLSYSKADLTPPALTVSHK